MSLIFHFEGIDIKINPADNKHCSVIYKVPAKSNALCFTSELLKSNPVLVAGENGQKVVHEITIAVVLFEEVKIARENHHNCEIKIY